MSTIADDIRAAAKLLDEDVWLAGKLLAHADLIERVIAEMRANIPRPTNPKHRELLAQWVDALATGELK